MKIITHRQQRNVCVRMIALYRMCNAMAKNLPNEQYCDYVDKYTDAIVDIVGNVCGLDMLVAFGKATEKANEGG